MSEELAYARKASGLVRGLSMTDAFAVGFMNQGLTPSIWVVVSLGLGVFLGGIPLMFWWNSKDRTFFDRGRDPIDDRPPPEGGNPLPPLVGATRVVD